jgi:hypothetical protein
VAALQPHHRCCLARTPAALLNRHPQRCSKLHNTIPDLHTPRRQNQMVQAHPDPPKSSPHPPEAIHIGIHLVFNRPNTTSEEVNPGAT